MEHMQLVINSVLTERRNFTANHYDIVITAERQLILHKLKTVKDRVFKAVKKLMEMSGKFLRIKENVYRDLRQPDHYAIVIVKPQQTKIRDDFLDKLIEEYPTSPMTITTLNTSDDITSITHNGYIITLCFGNNAFDFLFETASAEIQARLKKSTENYILSLTKEFISTFNEEK